MNLVKIEFDCKKEGRRCFDNLKHHLINFPFLTSVDKNSVNNAIKWEIEMKFGSAVLKNHITGNESKIQSDLMMRLIYSYKTTIKNTCWTWANKNFSL